MPGWHIAVSGLPGAGKTTLVRALAAELGGLALEERDSENPYLARFYGAPPEWALKSFVFFFVQTMGDYRRARDSRRGGVQERLLEEHLVVFGAEFHRRGWLNDDDLATLTELTAVANGLLAPPDLLIHLEIDPALAQKRLHQRGAAPERSVELDYLEALGDRYSDLLADWKGEIVRIDAARHDFRKGGDVAGLAEQVEKRLATVAVG